MNITLTRNNGHDIEIDFPNATEPSLGQKFKWIILDDNAICIGNQCYSKDYIKMCIEAYERGLS